MSTQLDCPEQHSPPVDEHGLDASLRRVSRHIWRDSLYSVSALPIAIAALILILVVLTLGLGLAIVVVGVPLTGVAVTIARSFAGLERSRLRSIQGLPAPTPTYRQPSPTDGFWRRVVTPLLDPQSWRDVAWTVLGALSATVAAVLTLTWWAAAGAGLTYWLWQFLILADSDTLTLASALDAGHGRVQESVVNFVIGAIALISLPYAARFAARAHAALATALLVGSPLGSPRDEES